MKFVEHNCAAEHLADSNRSIEPSKSANRQRKPYISHACRLDPHTATSIPRLESCPLPLLLLGSSRVAEQAIGHLPRPVHCLPLSQSTTSGSAHSSMRAPSLLT